MVSASGYAHLNRVFRENVENNFFKKKVTSRPYNCVSFTLDSRVKETQLYDGKKKKKNIFRLVGVVAVISFLPCVYLYVARFVYAADNIFSSFYITTVVATRYKYK